MHTEHVSNQLTVQPNSNVEAFETTEMAAPCSDIQVLAGGYHENYVRIYAINRDHIRSERPWLYNQLISHVFETEETYWKKQDPSTMVMDRKNTLRWSVEKGNKREAQRKPGRKKHEFD